MADPFKPIWGWSLYAKSFNDVPWLGSKHSVWCSDYSENSLLLLAIYESEEKAEEARQVVDIFFKENAEHTHDLIVFHGEVMNDEPYAVMA